MLYFRIRVNGSAVCFDEHAKEWYLHYSGSAHPDKLSREQVVEFVRFWKFNPGDKVETRILY